MFIVITKKKLYRILIILLCVVLAIVFMVKFKTKATFNDNIKPQIAIVIDDFGNYSNGTEEMLNLEVPITAAIMPFMPSSKIDAEKAKEKGKEVIVHYPMEPEHGKASWLGPKGITTNLTDEEVKIMLNEAFEEIDNAVGLNNHMGSKVMQDERLVKDIMEVLKEKNKFFLDSKTTANSKAEKLSKELGIKYYERAVFLDNKKDIGSIEKQLDQAIRVAIKDGSAIAIGHVGVEGGKVTAQAIKNKIPYFKEKGIEIVPISSIK